MVNLITGQEAAEKTQQMIDLANERLRLLPVSVFIKRSSKDTYSVDFNIRASRWLIILTSYLEEFVGFLYGMAAGNHDIEAVFIRQYLKAG